MSARSRLLLVDDDVGLLRTLQVLLEDEGGYAVETAASGEEARARLQAGGAFAAVVTDLAMPGVDGLGVLATARESCPGVPVILMTAYGSVRDAVEAMRAGAYQFLTKPVEPDELLVQIERALEHATLRAAHRGLRERAGDPERFDVLVGDSPVMAELRAAIDRLARVDSTVLLRGETGTGKELVARLIHRLSARAARPFVVVNCTAIPGELIESELFGHERGAFTGATTARAGRIAEAEGGTLLLDEVGDMPPALQPKLLRFLQERVVQRVGGGRERTVDVRVIAATHRNLEDAMASGGFRADLFHRLNALPVHLPALRDHSDDLAALAAHLLAKICRRLARPCPSLPPEALAELSSYPFPGNVRELENLLERAVVLGPEEAGKEGFLDAGSLHPPTIGTDPSMAAIPLDNGMAYLADAHARAEAALIRRALVAWPRLSHGEIAERLGTSRRILELRLKQMRERFD